jgi:hypothetical protein
MFRIIVVVLLCCVAASQPVLAGDDAEKEAVTKAIMDYAEGWYAGDAARMESCLHPELAKRVMKVDKDSGEGKLESLSAAKLIEYTKAAYGKNTPKDKQLKDVTIFDVYGNAATAKLEMAGWVDYMHLAKQDGKWVIVNVLWDPKPGK